MEFWNLSKMPKQKHLILFNIKTEESQNEEILEVKEETKKSKVIEINENNKESVEQETQTIKQERETIILNDLSKNKDSNEKVIYESKNYKIIKYTPYAFSLFLIFIIIVLMREKL